MRTQYMEAKRMRKIVGTLALGLGLLALGDDAQAASPFCLDLSAFCDCLTVNIVNDNTGGQPTRRYYGTWQNTDCAGATANMQGGQHDNSYLAGELPNVGNGLNWNFTWRSNGVFDLDQWDGISQTKGQNDQAYVIVPGACPADCSAAAKPQGLPASSER
jgi:hypothetical protein